MNLRAQERLRQLQSGASMASISDNNPKQVPNNMTFLEQRIAVLEQQLADLTKRHNALSSRVNANLDFPPIILTPQPAPLPVLKSFELPDFEAYEAEHEHAAELEAINAENERYAQDAQEIGF